MSINDYTIFFTYQYNNEEYNKFVLSKPMSIEKMNNNSYILSHEHPFSFSYSIKHSDLKSNKAQIKFLLCTTNKKFINMANKNDYKVLQSFIFDSKKIYDCCDNVPMHYFDAKLMYDTNILYDILSDLLPYLAIKNIIKYIDVESWIEMNMKIHNFSGNNTYFISCPIIKIPNYIYYRHLS